MTTPIARLAGTLVLIALLLGAYTLIAARPADSPSATAKIQLKKPPAPIGEVQEGTGI